MFIEAFLRDFYMIRIGTLLTLVTLVSIASTCEQDISLELPSSPEQLVVLCNFTPNEPFQVVVSRSHTLLDAPHSPNYVPDAEVRIFNGNTLLANLNQWVESEKPDVASYYTNTSFIPQVGQPYTIKVRTKGMPPVQATDAIPLPVPLQEVRIVNFSSQASDLQGIDRFKFSIRLQLHDPPGQENFYHINVYQKVHAFLLINNGHDTLWSPPQLVRTGIANSDWQDGIFSTVDKGLLFSDKQYDGDIISMKLNIDFFLSIPTSPYSYVLGDVYIELRSTSHAYYLYHSTLSRQQENLNKPFSEPVAIYNNIQGGLGNFSGYSTFISKITPPPQ